MTDDRKTPEQWIDALRRLRDGVEVQAHLADMELRGRLDQLDDQLATFRARAEKVSGAAEKASADVGAAFSMLGQTIADGLEKVRAELERQT